jgi:hypothetical protein
VRCEMRDARCEMMTAGTRCVLGRIDVDVDVDIDVDQEDSPMLREERRTKGQQSFTIRFRRDKLAVIFPRIKSSQRLCGGPGPGSGCTSIHPARAQLALDMLASVSRNSLPRPASRTHAPSEFRRKRALYARRPFRQPAHVLTAAGPNPSLHSQFGPLRMGRHCGKEGVC